MWIAQRRFAWVDQWIVRRNFTWVTQQSSLVDVGRGCARITFDQFLELVKVSGLVVLVLHNADYSPVVDICNVHGVRWMKCLVSCEMVD